MDLLTGKIASAFLFLFSALVCTLLPFCVGRRRSSSQSATQRSRCQYVMDVCNSFAGGIFLSTCFVGLLPFVRNSFIRAFEMRGLDSDYPLAEVMLLSGFFLMVLIEQIVVKTTQRRGEVHPGDAEEDHALMQETHLTESHSGHSHHSILQTKSLLHSAALVLALGMHTMFEGMAVGLQTSLNTLMTLVAAVCVHEMICSLALGFSLCKQAISARSVIVICVVFSAMMPIGIFIGIGLNELQGFVGMIVSSTLQGIATGTFMYVVFLEILPTSLAAKNVFVQLFAMFLGAACLVIVIYFTHDHGDMIHTTQSVIEVSNQTVIEASNQTTLSDDLTTRS